MTDIVHKCILCDYHIRYLEKLRDTLRDVTYRNLCKYGEECGEELRANILLGKYTTIRLANRYHKTSKVSDSNFIALEQIYMKVNSSVNKIIYELSRTKNGLTKLKFMEEHFPKFMSFYQEREEMEGHESDYIAFSIDEAREDLERMENTRSLQEALNFIKLHMMVSV